MPNLLQTRRIWFSPDGNTSEDWLQLFECLPSLLDLPNWAHLSFRRPVLSFLLGWSRARGRDRSCPLIKVRGLLWGPYIWRPQNLQLFITPAPNEHSSVSSVFVHTFWQNHPLFASPTWFSLVCRRNLWNPPVPVVFRVLAPAGSAGLADPFSIPSETDRSVAMMNISCSPRFHAISCWLGCCEMLMNF